ncbi:hypothetical protein MSAN_01726700 [Mycena sanguinolenta]|uniref:F-box domain-containing protein n=1 Tax=Mycena sanguinolenta TaxID=230812 RepID=A0A8H6XZT3_9AGAR|nr:hypothetical protein MSAN_01726700 [Mycena sanguinolenta]
MNNDPVFPPELFAVIIGALAADLETLRSCALVSSAFYGLARVFSHLQVGPLVDGEHDFPQFCTLLEGSPPFAARVESLRLWTEPNPRNWILEADLGQCLSLLVSLTRLCIAVDDSGYLPWFTLSHANRHSIQAILPTLTCLELKNVTKFPLTLLSHCSSLRSLTLDDAIFATRPGTTAHTDSCSSSSSIHLRHLVLRVRAIVLVQFVDWIANLESLFDFSCLRSLEYRADAPRDHLPIQRLLNAASPSLQHLCIQNHYFLTDKLHELDLRQLAQLRTLALDIYLDDSESHNHQTLLSLGNFVFPPPQQQLALVLDVFTEDEPQRTDITQHLAGIDHILARLPFETVTIIVRAWYPEDGRKEKLLDVCDEFVPAMPLLASKPGRRDRLRILESLPVQ